MGLSTRVYSLNETINNRPKEQNVHFTICEKSATFVLQNLCGFIFR